VASGRKHGRHQSATPPSKRRAWLLSAAVAVAVVVIAAVALIVVDRGRGQPPVAAKASPPSESAGVALPVVVVGAKCATLGAAGIAESGGPAYCAHLQTTDAAIWSLYPGEISSPTVTPGPTDAVYPSETESPVLVCMEQTGQSKLDCHDDILQSNGGTTTAPSS
jgi:serine/threonine-protein kinase